MMTVNIYECESSPLFVFDVKKRYVSLFEFLANELIIVLYVLKLVDFANF